MIIICVNNALLKQICLLLIQMHDKQVLKWSSCISYIANYCKNMVILLSSLLTRDVLLNFSEHISVAATVWAEDKL